MATSDEQRAAFWAWMHAHMPGSQSGSPAWELAMSAWTAAIDWADRQQAAQVRADEQAAWIVEKVDAKLGAGWILKLAEQLHGVSYGPPSALAANPQQIASGEKRNG